MADQLLNLNIIFEHKARTTITYTIKKGMNYNIAYSTRTTLSFPQPICKYYANITVC